ncbi:LuxR family transcriptional regulator [Burkholderia ubonensis]|uniref:LuxR family transcriptional regulator n=1 Tax=Burkholderia ubonensis TaxID=101571 RepID=A0AB73FUP2_9BURK|nr:LuxR family transcriptional regulator [Burkholderia ubonensis]KVL78939.1 LuxR family transcriptional regulator [Burkholderia ubonensis]KVM24770.1 LuxR family transcriptional regulator [Burkholderia ubonensis]KVM37242.1 LuxR family transcriptional regulator [Burkholderia ubonensis]
MVYELRRDPGIRVVGTARSTDGLIEVLERCKCDVVVFDYTMSSGCNDQGDGNTMLSLMQRHHPDIGLVVFTTIDHPLVISSLLSQGISCIFSKWDDLGEMPVAIRAAEAKGEYLSPAIASIVRKIRVSESSSSNSQALTPRELEVTRLFVLGLTINEIAARLGRRKQTVSAQKWSAMRKLGVERDVDLIRYAIGMKLI